MSGEKDRLRFDLQNALRVLTVSERHMMSSRMQQHLVRSELWEQASCILLYSSLPGEPRTVELLIAGRDAGKQVCYPRVRPGGLHMDLFEVQDPEQLARGRFGILEPPENRERQVHPSAVDVALIPGLGFDLRGNRLGRGMGFYDRFLGEPDFRATKVGSGFSCQIMDALPIEPHDVPMDALATEKDLQVLEK